MFEGKIVNGRWEPGKINTLLGRNLECGQPSWYQNLWWNRGDYWYTFKCRFLRRDYYVEFCPLNEADRDYYAFKAGMTKRQAEKYLNSLLFQEPRIEANAWIERDRPKKS